MPWLNCANHNPELTMKGLSVLLLVASVVVARAENKCPPEQEGNWQIEQLLAHEDCHKFYKCTFGYPVEMVCPSDLYFNLELWQCDWRENVYCGDRNDPAFTTNVPPTTEEPTTEEPTTEEPTTEEPTTEEPTTEEPTTEEPTTEEPTTEEPTTEEPTTEEPTTEEPTTEEPTTVEPTTEEPTTEEPTTEEPTTEEPTTEEPTTEEPTTEEPTTEEPTTEEPTTEEPTTLEPTTEAVVDREFLENGCPVNPHIHWLLPHEDDCNLFYYCVWGEKVLRQCPASLHFNRELQVCDWPKDAGCATSFDKHIIGRRSMSQVEVSLTL